MPVSRDSEGNIIERPTKHTGAEKPARATEHPTEFGGRPRPQERPQSQPSTSGNNPYDAKTVIAGRAEAQPSQAGTSGGEPKTRLYHPPNHPVAEKATAMDDPPVGWLVVSDGPGQGNVVTLGFGVNSIGRDASERLSLDFGDGMISRSNHTTITYDPRGKKFYIQHGDGVNLTYVNDQPVLAPQELKPNTDIQIGNTTLRFIPLCGEHFDWDSQKGARRAD